MQILSVSMCYKTPRYMFPYSIPRYTLSYLPHGYTYEQYPALYDHMPIPHDQWATYLANIPRRTYKRLYTLIQRDKYSLYLSPLYRSTGRLIRKGYTTMLYHTTTLRTTTYSVVSLSDCIALSLYSIIIAIQKNNKRLRKNCYSFVL